MVTIAVVAVLTLIGMATGGDDGSDAERTVQAVAHTPEGDLTTIELGHEDSNSLTYRRLVSLLDSVQDDCPSNTRTELADYTANVMTILDENGIAAKPSEILEQVRESTALRYYDSCLDMFSAYALIRIG